MTAIDSSTSTALIAFGAAVVGALVGGGAAALGSDWAQRRQIRRAARIRMFAELSQRYGADRVAV